jgi:FkbM family methyltransferase
MKEKNIFVKLSLNSKFLLTLKNPWVFLKDCAGLIKDKFIFYRLRGGIVYKVNSGSCDRGIIKEIFFHKCYNPEGFDISEEDIVFDVGAQAGIFSVYAAKLAKNGKVYSFEPVPQNFSLLKENLGINGCRNAFCYNAAIAKEEGKRNIFLSAGNTGGHSLVQLRRENDQTVEVDSFSLEKFMARKKSRK